MKIQYLILLLLPVFLSVSATAQCIPGDSISCPDPENNGQICPDTIAPAYRGVDYSQDITFLAPSKIDTLSLSIDVYNITLVDIEGLPEGMEWETNAEDNEFYPEIYYCILFSGNTAVDTGSYPITIVVDIYALIFGQPVKVATIEDSTSLAMRVLEEPSAVGDAPEQLAARIWPNPFTRNFSIALQGFAGNVDLELLNILGERLYKKQLPAVLRNSTIQIDASFLPDGIYFVALTNGEARRTYLISKRQ
jgi:hypothetical protein